MINMKTIFFSTMSIAMTVLLLWPVVLSAQSVSGLSVGTGTVTFDVSWNKPDVPGGKVWMFVDYNDNGVMQRLPISGATVSAGTASIVPNNDKGVWVVNSEGVDNFSTSVTLSFNSLVAGSGACAYASGYPPMAEYATPSSITFTGTPPFDLTLSTGAISVQKGYELLGSQTLLSFTDKTGAPGMIIPATYALTASDTGFCAESSDGVSFALQGTQKDVEYQLYRDVTPVGTILTGTGSAATFSGTFYEGVYTAQSVAGDAKYCQVTMTGSHNISRNPLPTLWISQPPDVCLNGGDIVFTATGSGMVEWVSTTDGGTVNENTVTYASGATTGTKTVTAQSAQTYSGAPTCYSSTVAQSATVNAIPTITCFGNASQTVTINMAISPITYTTSNATSINLSEGSLPDGVSGSANGTTYTISGTPTSAGTFEYVITAMSASNCSSSTSGTLVTGSFSPPHAYSAKIWQMGSYVVSDRIVYEPASSCTMVSGGAYTSVGYTKKDGLVVYSSTCARKIMSILCPSPWEPLTSQWIIDAKIPAPSDWTSTLHVDNGGIGYQTSLLQWADLTIYTSIDPMIYWSSGKPATHRPSIENQMDELRCQRKVQ
jgi:hypothetical protein